MIHLPCLHQKVLLKLYSPKRKSKLQCRRKAQGPSPVATPLLIYSSWYSQTPWYTQLCSSVIEPSSLCNIQLVSVFRLALYVTFQHTRGSGLAWRTVLGVFRSGRVFRSIPSVKSLRARVSSHAVVAIRILTSAKQKITRYNLKHYFTDINLDKAGTDNTQHVLLPGTLRFISLGAYARATNDMRHMQTEEVNNIFEASVANNVRVVFT